MKSLFHSLLSVLLALALLAPMVLHPAHAGLVSTSEAIAADQATDPGARVAAYLQQAEVRDQLLALGVDPVMAEVRVAALSPAELAEMAERLDDMPAGAGVIEVLGITFLVLLILHVTGILRIFN